MNSGTKIMFLVAWTALGVFVAAAVASVSYATGLAYGARPPGALGICGNSVSDPICAVLSYGVPFLFGSVVVTCYRARRLGTSWTYPAGFAVLSAISASAFLYYARSFFQPLFGDAPVLKGVWWIAPFL